MSPDGALPRARWLWHAERLLHLPSETAVQRVFLPHPLVVQAFNLYYAGLHFPVLFTCLVWLFIWHRDQYRQVRTTVVLFTAAALLIQLIPVAPPRLLPGTGLVDTAVLYGQSVYLRRIRRGRVLGHAVGACRLVDHRGHRGDHGVAQPVALAGGLYPLLTLLVVVVTANHYWLDGVAAGLLVVLVLGAAEGRAVGDWPFWLNRPEAATPVCDLCGVEMSVPS